MSTGIHLLDPGASLSENAKVIALAYWTFGSSSENQSVCFSVAGITSSCLCPHPLSVKRKSKEYSDLLSFIFSLTSEMKEAQMVCNNLRGSFLCTEFDSTREKDVSFTSRDDCMAFMRYLYIRHMNDTWKHHRLRTVRQTEVTHRGTFQGCI